jgi:hypothetical protein
MTDRNEFCTQTRQVAMADFSYNADCSLPLPVVGNVECRILLTSAVRTDTLRFTFLRTYNSHRQIQTSNFFNESDKPVNSGSDWCNTNRKPWTIFSLLEPHEHQSRAHWIILTDSNMQSNGWNNVGPSNMRTGINHSVQCLSYGLDDRGSIPGRGREGTFHICHCVQIPSNR